MHQVQIKVHYKAYRYRQEFKVKMVQVQIQVKVRILNKIVIKQKISVRTDIGRTGTARHFMEIIAIKLKKITVCTDDLAGLSKQ